MVFGFEATLSSKMNVLNFWKGHFYVLWEFLSNEVETVFWESFLENGFEATLRSKNECS